MGSGDIYTNVMRVIAKQMDVDDALAMKTLERMRRESAIYNPFPSTGETSYVPSTGETSYVHNIARVCLAVVGLACGMRPRRAVLLSLRPGLASALAGAIAARRGGEFKVPITSGPARHSATIPHWMMLNLMERGSACNSAVAA